jgi:hypothetical protein
VDCGGGIGRGSSRFKAPPPRGTAAAWRWFTVGWSPGGGNPAALGFFRWARRTLGAAGRGYEGGVRVAACRPVGGGCGPSDGFCGRDRTAGVG